MEILLNLVLTGVGIAMLCGGGNWLVDGSVSVARRMGMSSLIVGMTVVAYGTSTPELAASIAAAGEHGDIILGNVIGSNVANVGMVIGAAAIMTILLIGNQTLRREIPIMIGVSMLLVILSLDGGISMWDGAILIGALIVFTIFTFTRRSHAKTETHLSDPSKSGTSDYATKSYVKSFGLIGIGMGLLYVGAILTVDNAVAVAEAFNIPQKVIGITVIAIGTSLPELITTIIAIRRGHTDIGVGNIIGSNIYNILMIMGVAAVIAEISVAPPVFVDYAIMIGFSLVLFVALKSGRVPRLVGLGLVAGYAAYLAASLLI